MAPECFKNIVRITYGKVGINNRVILHGYMASKII
jgi:hypothetical protein